METVYNIETEEDFLRVSLEVFLIIDFLNSRNTIAKRNWNLFQAIQEILDNLYDELMPINLLNETSVAAVKNELKDLIFKTGCSAEKVYELLLSKGFNKERSKIVSSAIENRKSELLYSTLLHYNSEHGETVTEFDWAVKLVHGTSELKKLKYPLLQLAFTTHNKGRQQQRIYDVNKDMLDRMISVLENIDTQSWFFY